MNKVSVNAGVDVLKSLQKTYLNKSIFSAGWEFWVYHAAGQLFILLLSVVSSFFIYPTSILMANVGGAVALTFGMSISGLVLRRQYLEREWHAQGIVRVMTKTLGLSMVLSLFSVLLMAAVIVVFFYGDIAAYIVEKEIKISAWNLFVLMAVANWVQTVFYLVCWMALYIAITNVRRTKQTEVDNLRLQNSLKEAKLSSLSNQLNPHFLFNALNNIRFMIGENGEHAEEMLMSLSEVLRYSLESSKQDKVKLVKEMEIIERYINLVKIQFEDRLQFEMKLAPGVEQCLVPPMILQMLIENAVKHGVERIQSGGTIVVDVQLQDEMLVLRVSNDTPETDELDGEHTGIGLKNISQRLKLLYGNNATLDANADGGQFRAEIRLTKEC